MLSLAPPLSCSHHPCLCSLLQPNSSTTLSLCAISLICLTVSLQLTAIRFCLHHPPKLLLPKSATSIILPDSITTSLCSFDSKVQQHVAQLLGHSVWNGFLYWGPGELTVFSWFYSNLSLASWSFKFQLCHQKLWFSGSCPKVMGITATSTSWLH